MSDNPITRTERLTRGFIHVVVIGMIFILPEVLATTDHSHHKPDIFRWIPYAKAALFVVIFYMEYWLLRARRKLGWQIAGTAAVVILGSMGLYLLHLYVGLHYNFKPRSLSPMMMREAAMVMLTAGLGIAMRLSERMRMIKESQRREELKQLKSQLNPHFLFNSLNTVYVLTEVDPHGAREAVHNLSTLLRYALYEADAPTVALKREITFITDYVGLMRARLGESLKVIFSTDIEPGMENTPIAPMMFVVLVENAFKYSDKGCPGAFVSINIALHSDKVLECVVNNSFDPTDTSEKSRSVHPGGVGLENLRRRLALIYGSRASLRTSAENNIFNAHLKISHL